MGFGSNPLKLKTHVSVLTRRYTYFLQVHILKRVWRSRNLQQRGVNLSMHADLIPKETGGCGVFAWVRFQMLRLPTTQNIKSRRSKQKLVVP